MKWIVGLGNLGKRYAGTPHNIGFRVVDRFARRHSFEEFRPRFSGLFADRALDSFGGERIMLLKPATYMNRSGLAVQEALGYHGGDLRDLIVVHDDLDLPAGQLRYRSGGSSGGHRGVESIQEILAAKDFARLKIGIGRREGLEPSQFVLEEPDREELAILELAADRAAESLELWISGGVERAANRYNVRSTASGKGPTIPPGVAPEPGKADGKIDRPGDGIETDRG